MHSQWIGNIKNDTALALRFFSRLGVPNCLKTDSKQSKPEKLNEAVTAFPVAGLIIALPPALLWLFCSQFLSPFLAACIAVASGAIVTGTLHEDGMADCADGLGGIPTRERALEIMRDSSIGTYGATALFFSFVLRIAALASLSPWSGTIALLMAHSTARAFLAIPIHITGYARPSGLGNIVDSGVNIKQLKVTLVTASIILFILVLFSGQFSGLLAPLAAVPVTWRLLRYTERRLGGYTGDSLGAMEQTFEITVMVVLSVLWS